MSWTVLKLLNWTSDYFRQRGLQTPRLDAEVLLSDTLHYTRVELYTHFDQPLTTEELSEYRTRVSRRAAREPVAYIVGRKEFWALDFEVGPGVLIPRPDTEILVQEAIALLGKKAGDAQKRRTLPWNEELTRQLDDARADSENPIGKAGADEQEVPDRQANEDGEAPSESTGTPVTTQLVLDLCTGSGIIPVCLARDTDARVIGTDISPTALEFARRNVSRYTLEKRVALLQGDLIEPLPPRFYGKFDLVTSNPPYLTPDLFETLAQDIVRYEPREALLSGPDGLALCRRIVPLLNRMLKPGGWVLIEIGTGAQADALSRLLEDEKLTKPEVLKDLAGLPRVVKAQRPGS